MDDGARCAPQRERFDRWRTVHAEAHSTAVLVDPVASIPLDSRSSAKSLALGPVSLVELHCGPSTGRWQREGTDAADQVRVAMFYRATGEGWGVVIGRSRGSWVAPSGFSTIQVSVARAALPFDDATLDRICARGLPRSTPAFDAVVGPLLQAAVGRLDGLAAHAPDLGAVWLSAVTLLLRAIEQHRDAGSGEIAPAHRVQALRHIDAHLADPALCPAGVAAALHISRRRLYQVFASDGDGVAGTIRRRRLEQARRVLGDPSHRRVSVAEVGAAVGLPNPAHFSRLFRVAYGVSPRAHRSAALADACSRATTSCRSAQFSPGAGSGSRSAT